MTDLPKRLRLGDMLTLAGIVTAADVEEALAIQKGSGRGLGAVLVELGKVSEHQLAQVLSNQLSIPWVNLHHVDFSRELLNLVPADLAEKAALVPIYVRKVRHQGDTLFVATDDPLNETALALVAATVGMPVKPMVAGSSDVRGAIRAYYGRGLPAPAPRVEPKPLIPAIPPAEEPELIFDEEVHLHGPPVAPDPEVTPPPQTVADEPPVKKKRSGPKMITLTLLDGTKVRLPAPGSESSEEAEKQLTTRDLVAALIARTQGKDVSKVLPDSQWEALFATLLSLLMRKGLVADWEFVEEWSKHRAKR